jgi:hypothetical protein
VANGVATLLVLADPKRCGHYVAATRKMAVAWRAGVERRTQLDACVYWADGAKRRNSVKLTNSDPELLALFADFLESELNVTRMQMRLSCNLFADHVERQREIEDYWLTRLGLPRSCLRKSVVNTFSKYSNRTRIGKLPYGTSALYVHSTRIVQTIYGSIQEYGGFDRPEWLD